MGEMMRKEDQWAAAASESKVHRGSPLAMTQDGPGRPWVMCFGRLLLLFALMCPAISMAQAVSLAGERSPGVDSVSETPAADPPSYGDARVPVSESASGVAAGMPAADTKAAMRTFVDGIAFNILFVLAVGIFALSSILVAVELGYDFWGRLVFGFMASLGGGTIRDLLIAGDRIPFAYTRDPTFMVEILAITAVVSVLSATHAGFHQSPGFQQAKKYAEIIGFTLLATTGACETAASRLEWYWVPLCAALTCAGGGALRDIAAQRPPNTFRGVIVEEIAVMGGLCLVAGLYLVRRFPESGISIHVSIIIAAAVMAISRFVVVQFDLRYPTALLFKATRRQSTERPLDSALGPIPQQLRSIVTTQGRQWSVPHAMLLNAVKAVDESLSILATAGRGLPTHLHLEYDETIFKIVLSHAGSKIDTAVTTAVDPLHAIEDQQVEQWLLQTALQLTLQ
jgi:uncharacterized membrane protein YeiH